MGSGYRAPKGIEDVLRDLQRQINEVRVKAGLTSAVIGSGGITVKDGGGVTVKDGGEIHSENFDGDTSDNDPGTAGWALGNERLAFNGAFVPAVDTSSHEDLQTGFSLTSTVTDKASVTVTVPDWAATASVMATCVFTVFNTAGASRQVTVFPRINGEGGFSITRTLSDNELGIWTIAHSHTFDVSSIDSFEISGRMGTTSGTVPSSTSNGCALSSLVLLKSTA